MPEQPTSMVCTRRFRHITEFRSARLHAECFLMAGDVVAEAGVERPEVGAAAARARAGRPGRRSARRSGAATRRAVRVVEQVEVVLRQHQGGVGLGDTIGMPSRARSASRRQVLRAVSRAASTSPWATPRCRWTALARRDVDLAGRCAAAPAPPPRRSAGRCSWRTCPRSRRSARPAAAGRRVQPRRSPGQELCGREQRQTAPARDAEELRRRRAQRSVRPVQGEVGDEARSAAPAGTPPAGRRTSRSGRGRARRRWRPWPRASAWGC